MATAGLVISGTELERIRNTLGGGQLGGAASASTIGSIGDKTQVPLDPSRARAKELHEKSKARAKTWDNTLEGGRRKKAAEVQARLDAEEKERQQIDAEEAQIQLDQRKATIERANKLLHDESDRMKSFHAKLMMCDVLAEREAQVSLKGEMGKLEQIREDRFLEMEKQNYRRMLEREMKEKETREELSKITAKAQKQQLAEYKEKRFREVEDQMLEGELLRRKAVEDLENEQGAATKRRETAVRALQETQKANVYLKQIKAEDALRQQREEEKIQEYAVRKEKMLQLRKAKEEEVFNQKQAGRNAMIEAQAKRLAEMSNEEDTRVERQVAEKHASDEAKRLAKEEAKRKWEDDIQQSRAAQIHRKQMQRERERAEDVATAKFLGEWCKVLDKQEKDEHEAKRTAAKKLSQEHKKQVEIARQRFEQGKQQEEHIAIHARKAIEADTLEFHAYAESAIRDYAAEGKNVIPLIKELREFRKNSVQ
mmetsp:Transcript_35531/g.75780  ORF Transcript_35531/g.75780 Transcript_35531/m.75780 type:complete len:483 (+) Transcript_35531:83-1531(+)